MGKANRDAEEEVKSKRRTNEARSEADLVPRNAKGGVLITEEVTLLDSSGKITLSNLKKRLGVFYKNMPAKEYRFLMNNKNELTFEDLKLLLIDNEVKNFDPVAEAFKVYDPEGSGFVDCSVLRTIFENLGFGVITDDDLQILIETGDVDGDGKISLSGACTTYALPNALGITTDFRKMLDFDKQDLQQRHSAPVHCTEPKAENIS